MSFLLFFYFYGYAMIPIIKLKLEIKTYPIRFDLKKLTGIHRQAIKVQRAKIDIARQGKKYGNL